jgi:hypothetical protein
METAGHWGAVQTAGEAEVAGRNWRCVVRRKLAAAEVDRSAKLSQPAEEGEETGPPAPEAGEKFVGQY